MLGGAAGEGGGGELLVGEHARHVRHDQPGGAGIADDVGERVRAVRDRVSDRGGCRAHDVAEAISTVHVELHRQGVEVVADDIGDVGMILRRCRDPELDLGRTRRTRHRDGGRRHRDGERCVPPGHEVAGRDVERHREVPVGLRWGRRRVPEATGGNSGPGPLEPVLAGRVPPAALPLAVGSSSDGGGRHTAGRVVLDDLLPEQVERAGIDADVMQPDQDRHL